MTCKDARRLIHKSFGALLGDVERASLAQHLEECVSCKRYASLFSVLRTRLTGIAQKTDAYVNGSHVERFMRSSASRSGRGWFVLPWVARIRPLVYVATAASLLAALVFVAMFVIIAPSYSVADATLQQHRLRMTGQIVLDSHANSCEDLRKWFEAQVKHPVAMPRVCCEGMVVEGGKVLRCGCGDEILFAACRLEGKPVSLFICSGTHTRMPAGEHFVSAHRDAFLAQGSDYTMICWRGQKCTNVMVSPFTAEKSRAILSKIE